MKWLLIINTVVFLLWVVGGRAIQSHLLTLFALTPELTIRNFMVWQIVTYLFLHGGTWHLIFNMLTLWMFGSPLEQDWGTRRFLKYYFICGIGAGLFDLALNIALGRWNSTTIGASGAIYGLLVGFGVCYPEQTVLMSFLFPIKAKYMVMIYAGVELLMSTGVNSGVSNIAHLGGMVVGFLYLKSRMPNLHFALPDYQGAYRQWKLRRAKKKFQVYMKKHDRGPWVN
ncbi:MAG: rhomboid family intramembrane serine protease [Candidatus Solibacter sp.]